MSVSGQQTCSVTFDNEATGRQSRLCIQWFGTLVPEPNDIVNLLFYSPFWLIMWVAGEGALSSSVLSAFYHWNWKLASNQ